MAGHNKWSKIKNKKAVTDAYKAKVFSKLVRFITVESKKSKGDINSPGLRSAIDKARAENVPSDNIERAIKKEHQTLNEVLGYLDKEDKKIIRRVERIEGKLGLSLN